MSADVRLVVTPTSAIVAAYLDVVRALMDDAFEGDFSAEDWRHALGGTHVLAWDGGDLLGHASLIARQLLIDRRPIRAGYVEAVGVRTDRQRQGIGARLMDEIERLIRESYELGALGDSDAGFEFYRVRGWQPWLGPTYADGPAGVVRTEDDDGAILVLPVRARLDLTGTLACGWREGDVW